MKEIVSKAAKTFVQATIAYIMTLNLSGIDFKNKNMVAGLVLSAIAAGISALMNVDWSGIEKGKNPPETAYKIGTEQNTIE